MPLVKTMIHFGALASTLVLSGLLATTARAGPSFPTGVPALLPALPEAARSRPAAATKAAQRGLAEQQPVANYKAIAELRKEVENLTDAIASGALKSSPALASRLTRAETKLAELDAKKPSPTAACTVPKLADG